MTLPPAVVVHGLDQARRALAPGRPVLLLSARGAAGWAGAGWWRALMRAAGAEAAAVDALDCADEAGRALEAMAAGCRLLVLEPCPAWEAAAAAARDRGVRLLRARPAALDLGRGGAERRLAAWLEGAGGIG